MSYYLAMILYGIGLAVISVLTFILVLAILVAIGAALAAPVVMVIWAIGAFL